MENVVLPRRQIDGEGGAVDGAAEFLNEFYGGGGGPASSQEIVAQNHSLARLDGIFVNFHSIGTVFECVGNRDRFGGKFFWFAHRNEARSEAVGQCRTENKAARFDAGHDVDGVIDEVIAKPVDQRMKSLLVFQQRGQIVEQNSRLRIVRHFANQLL